MKTDRPPCAKCGMPDPAPVWNATEKVNKGWFCKHCGEFTKAIGREKALLPDRLRD